MKFYSIKNLSLHHPSMNETYYIYTISLNNSQGLGEIIIFFHVIKRQLLEGGDYFKYKLAESLDLNVLFYYPLIIKKKIVASNKLN